MLFKLSIIVLVSLLTLAREITSDGTHSTATTASANSATAAGPEGISPGGYDLPPPAAGQPPPPVPPVGPGFPIGGGWPGLGFSKSLDISGGYGLLPFLSGLGGFGGGVPPPIDGGYGAPIGGGFLGPSYLPSTWLGSALGAKGDILFPIVIVIFFIVGVWTVIQFLLALIVPLIAAKVGATGVVHSLVDSKRNKRSIPEPPNPNLCHDEEKMAQMSQKVHDAIDKPY